LINIFLSFINKISDENATNSVINKQVSEIDQVIKTLTNKDELLEMATKLLINSILNDEHRKAFGFSRFIFLCAFNEPFEMIKKHGAFRSSKYGYKVNLLKRVMLDICDKCNPKDKELRYIKSAMLLLSLSPDILSLKINIQSFIKSRPNFLKNALAIAEMHFHDIDNYDVSHDISLKDSLYYASRETFISSVSYTLQLFKEITPVVTCSHSMHIEECSMDGVYLQIFYNAYLIQIFNEQEINVDFFEYSVDVCADDEKSVAVHNADFEYSLRQGYVKSELRWNAICSRLLKNQIPGESHRFSEFMFDICKDGFAEKNLYVIKRHPIERVVLTTAFNCINDNDGIFKSSELFFEEIAMLYTLSLENYNCDFLEVKLFKNFTSLDLIKIQRFFGYTSYVYNYAYEQLLKSGELNAKAIRKRSLLPVMKTLELAKIFNIITGHSTEDCLSFISRISIDFSEESGFLDLQYSPIIKMGDASLILPSVLSNSNLIRSFALKEKINLSTFEDKDHMVESIKRTLQNAGFHVKADFKYGKNEIDILAYLDGSLFIFECKNPYHPVNSFELRNTYGHIQKGFKQINKFKRILSERESLKQLLLNADLGFCNVEKIHYGIINANRALYGLSNGDVKVYHANEMINFLETGNVICMEEGYNVWSGNAFTVNDFFRYLNGEVITSDFEKIKVDVLYKYLVKTHSIVLLTNAFDIDELPKVYSNKYKAINVIN